MSITLHRSELRTVPRHTVHLSCAFPLSHARRFPFGSTRRVVRDTKLSLVVVCNEGGVQYSTLQAIATWTNVFCDTTFSVVPTFCRVVPSLCRPIHIALDKRAQSLCRQIHLTREFFPDTFTMCTHHCASRCLWCVFTPSTCHP